MSEKRSRRWGPVYWNASLYDAAMRLLRPDGRRPLFEFLAKEIGALPALELCCGSAELSRWLKTRAYQGIDLNPRFVAGLRRRGLDVCQADVLSAPWPGAACLVMIDSLYHFLPDAEPLLARMKAHPARKLILAESVEHVASRPLLSRLALWATQVEGRQFPDRYCEATMRGLLERHGFQRVERIGADVVGVLERR